MNTKGYLTKQEVEEEEADKLCTYENKITKQNNNQNKTKIYKPFVVIFFFFFFRVKVWDHGSPVQSKRCPFYFWSNPKSHPNKRAWNCALQGDRNHTQTTKHVWRTKAHGHPKWDSCTVLVVRCNRLHLTQCERLREDSRNYGLSLYRCTQATCVRRNAHALQ